MWRFIPALLALLALAWPARVLAVPEPGLRRIEIPASQSYFLRYVPASLDRSRPAPLVLFFHGAGGNPSQYVRLITAAAERTGAVVALPKSSGLGWGTAADAQSVSETLRLAGTELTFDADRTAVAGHSAGGAYAYLLAYSGPRFSAVFTLAASYYPVASLADTTYTPPIRMYYGTTDPNYTRGAYANLKAQWNRLGVPLEEDVRPGYGHGDWPADAMEAGFLFLAAKSRAAAASCLPTAQGPCLNRGRFRVEVAWQAAGLSGAGTAVPQASADSALFWFFSPDNWELLVKVIDGCAVNGRYWVFAAATTDVRYVLTVIDTQTGRTARYENPPGVSAPAVTDTSAFPVCP